MKILQISDTHNKHRLLTNLPAADVIVHCGDFADRGTEEEVLDFLNWFIELPYAHKIFITGNHDLCLWEAEGIEDLPDNLHFLQDRGCVIDRMKFFGIAYNHDVRAIPTDTDVLITHEPPLMILDESNAFHWGNRDIRGRVAEVRPQYHLFGHAHEGYGLLEKEGVVYSNAALLDDHYQLCHEPHLFELEK